MKLPSYAAMMASIGATGLALMAYGGEPLPNGWLDGIVAPGSTIGGAVAILGTWALGIGTTALGVVALAQLALDAWRHWRGLRPRAEGRAVG
ncbi:hypothetical protein [Siccirubricoccus phaeus]|uniref:hypothetical protein n=1 Tax=Siccirubricoccus phaeus TaxID=2595053 RepID=UPI0011F17FB0|nr:hypothetical protein [Siccirubricoccus phaeus]